MSALPRRTVLLVGFVLLLGVGWAFARAGRGGSGSNALVSQASVGDSATARLVNELTQSGPLVVFGSWVWPEYFSPKVGCKVFQTTYGVADFGALCKHS